MARKLITSAQAAKILGCTGQNVRLLGAKGMLTKVEKVQNNHTTTYYYASEIRARKAACRETLVAAREAQEVLEEAKRILNDAKKARKEALAARRSFERHAQYEIMFSELVVGCVSAYAGDAGDMTRDFRIAADIAALTPWEEMERKYMLTPTRIRQIVTQTVRTLRKAPSLVDTIGNVKRYNDELRKENERLQAIIDKDEALKAKVDELHKATGHLLSEDDMRIREKLLTRVAEYGLSVRTYNCLAAADIETLGDLVYLKRIELMRMRNFGRKSMAELDYLVEKLKLRFDTDVTLYGVQPSASKYYRWLLWERE